MILAYMLPTGQGSFTLWTAATAKVGEIAPKKVVVLSPYDFEPELVTHLIHDYLYRFQAMKGLPRKHAASFWFRMLWGALYLIGMDNVVEDLVCGVYLLAAGPLFTNLMEHAWKKHAGEVVAQFKDAAYMPEVEVVYSRRLVALTMIVNFFGLPRALRRLGDLGLHELTGFYRRCCWSERWPAVTGAPTGLGVFHQNEEGKMAC